MGLSLKLFLDAITKEKFEKYLGKQVMSSKKSTCKLELILSKELARKCKCNVNKVMYIILFMSIFWRA